MKVQQRWRVRVKRSIEDWVDVIADDPLQAELQAASIPGVISVFGKSAISGMRAVDQVPAAGVMDEDE
jgi:hypothetical protein